MELDTAKATEGHFIVRLRASSVAIFTSSSIARNYCHSIPLRWDTSQAGSLPSGNHRLIDSIKTDSINIMDSLIPSITDPLIFLNHRFTDKINHRPVDSFIQRPTGSLSDQSIDSLSRRVTVSDGEYIMVGLLRSPRSDPRTQISRQNLY